MSVAKKPGRPSKYGDKDAKKIIKANAQELLEKAKQANKNDPAWAITVGVLQWVTANPDLVTEDSVPKVAKAIQDHPELRMTLLERANPDNSALTNIMLDAALRAGIVKVLKDEVLEDNREDVITSIVEKKKAAALSIAQSLKDKNNGKLPKKYLIQIAVAMQSEFGDLSESTIRRYLEE